MGHNQGDHLGCVWSIPNGVWLRFSWLTCLGRRWFISGNNHRGFANTNLDEQFIPWNPLDRHNEQSIESQFIPMLARHCLDGELPIVNKEWRFGLVLHFCWRPNLATVSVELYKPLRISRMLVLLELLSWLLVERSSNCWWTPYRYQWFVGWWTAKCFLTDG